MIRRSQEEGDAMNIRQLRPVLLRSFSREQNLKSFPLPPGLCRGGRSCLLALLLGLPLLYNDFLNWLTSAQIEWTLRQYDALGELIEDAESKFKPTSSARIASLYESHFHSLTEKHAERVLEQVNQILSGPAQMAPAPRRLIRDDSDLGEQSSPKHGWFCRDWQRRRRRGLSWLRRILHGHGGGARSWRGSTVVEGEHGAIMKFNLAISSITIPISTLFSTNLNVSLLLAA